MITYPEMNAKIKELLRGDGLSYTAYAAQRIEELEEENRELKKEVALLQSQVDGTFWLSAKKLAEEAVEENRRLRAVAEAAKDVVKYDWELGEVPKAVAAREALLQALAALDGGEKGGGIRKWDLLR